jgi:hypothetical protein
MVGATGAGEPVPFAVAIPVQPLSTTGATRTESSTPFRNTLLILVKDDSVRLCRSPRLPVIDTCPRSLVEMKSAGRIPNTGAFPPEFICVGLGQLEGWGGVCLWELL